MSHQVTVSGFDMTDLSCLDVAVAMLNRDGANIQIVKGDSAAIRGWNGQREKVDVALYMPNAQYDIGFMKGKDGVYSLRGEAYLSNGHAQSPVSGDKNVPNVDGKQCAWNPTAQMVGKLIAEYNCAVAEKAARNKGLMTTRQKAKDGTLSLVVTGV